MVFLGFLLDTLRQVVCIPLEKISKGKNMIQYILSKKKITLHELQRVCGYLNFLCKCIVPGHAFTQRLYSNISLKLKQHHHLRVSNEMRLDLSLRYQFLSHLSAFARPFMDFHTINACELEFYSDASKNANLGYGAYFSDEYIFQKWDPEFIVNCDPSIGYLELYAVTSALLTWMEKLCNRRVIVFVDNKSTMSNLNTMSSKCKNSMILIRLLVLNQMLYNSRIYGKYVTSKDNVGADDLSRMRVTKFLKDRADKGIIMTRRTAPDFMQPMEKL